MPPAVAVTGRTADAGDVRAGRSHDGQIKRAQLAGQRGRTPSGAICSFSGYRGPGET